MKIDHEQTIAELMINLGTLTNLRDVIRASYIKGVMSGQVEALSRRDELIKEWPINELWMIYELDR
jgi:hypothetical protein